MNAVKRCLLIVSIICLTLIISIGREKNYIWAEEKQVLTILSYTDTIRYFIDYFEERNPDITIELQVIPLVDYIEQIIPNLKSGKWSPDIFMGEYANIGELVESGFWEDLSGPPYNADASRMIPYVREVGTDSGGRIKALSYHSCVGGVIYRRSIARKYLGTDDPKKIGAMLETAEKLLKTARLLNQKSGGTVKLIAGISDYQHYPFAARKKPFVVHNRLHLDQPIMDFFDMAKTMVNERLTAEIDTWSDEWFENMNMSEPYFLAYMLPHWGLHYVIERHAENTAGDWGLCSGPESFYWGGDWIGICTHSTQKELAWRFIHFVTLNRETLKRFALDTGEFISDRTVINEIKNEFADGFLGGQNYYKFFAEEALNVDGSLLKRYELEIRGFLLNAIFYYIQGVMTKQKAIEQFKHDVKNSFPEVIVD
jgi:multiple sugar transport system substrate-binding protein